MPIEQRSYGAPLHPVGERKAVIKYVEMSKEMQQDAVQSAAMAIDKYHDDKDIALFLKKEFDRKYEPTWHCVIGSKFSSYVTHIKQFCIYFSLEDRGVLLFKTV
ncbi:unnamed protein product [Trichobilharzia szidati]|uniref:Dynein light chain n=1 Tax=Trichobilharzia regenti TaxID=157069 RepID=A0A183W575_TRIRE|nr:unnamed protein product [Trichobilharzia regenti]CAH8829212.1 unnamed protein product [Trichobilharzia szidati]VDQ03412.1 unnamed protein product [Trichobilharzia regenti]